MRPRDIADVVATLRCATVYGVPVVPRAAGTNVASGFLPTQEQILLDLRSMNRVLDIDLERRQAVVQPGLINGDLNAHLAPFGFCYSPDPRFRTNLHHRRKHSDEHRWTTLPQIWHHVSSRP